MNNIVYVFCIILIFKSIVFCQDNNQFPISHPELDESTFEAMPIFPGGDQARMEYLRTNINYPTLAREAGIQGTVYVSFVVDKSGKVNDVSILRGIGGGCDEEVIRLIESMPNWIPGIHRGNPVDMKMEMPVKFSLTADLNTNRNFVERDLKIEDSVFFSAEVMPEFKGGAPHRMRFLQENIRYPVEARNKGKQGTVYVKFIVETDGSLSKVEIISGIGYGCDEEVMRVINLMPNWSPGYQGNVPVRVEMVLPINFSLRTVPSVPRQK